MTGLYFFTARIYSYLNTVVFLFLFFSFVIAAERTETHLINAQGEMMGFGCISLRQLPHGRRCENVQLDFKERQHSFSARFGGMQTHVLLKQY